MIKRYSTPYHDFILPFLMKDITKIRITYSQNGEILLEKTEQDVTITDIVDILDNASMGEDFKAKLRSRKYYKYCSLVTVHLTQEETALFTFHKAAEKNIAIVQFHLKDNKDDSFVSKPVRMRVYGINNEEILQ